MVLSPAVVQRDVVWGEAGVNGDEANDGAWLRVRTETRDGAIRHLLTLKRSVTNQLDSIEHETEVSDPSETEKIVEQLGFVQFCDLTKTRQKGTVGTIELCLDTVDGLGDFIEAEMMTADDADYQAVVGELWATLEEIGVSREDEVTEGYDVLMNRHLDANHR